MDGTSYHWLSFRKIYYCIQVSTAPPTIVFFVNDPKLFTDNYQRFLERKIRDSLDFSGTPLKFIWRGKHLRDVARVATRGDRMTKNKPLNEVMGIGGGVGAANINPGLNPRNAQGNEVTTGKSPNRKQSTSDRMNDSTGVAAEGGYDDAQLQISEIHIVIRWCR